MIERMANLYANSICRRNRKLSDVPIRYRLATKKNLEGRIDIEITLEEYNEYINE